MKSLIKRFSVLICIMMISFAGCSISVAPKEESSASSSTESGGSGNTGGAVQVALIAVPQKAAVLLAMQEAQVLHKILLLQKKSKIIFPLH